LLKTTQNKLNTYHQKSKTDQYRITGWWYCRSDCTSSISYIFLKVYVKLVPFPSQNSSIFHLYITTTTKSIQVATYSLQGAYAIPFVSMLLGYILFLSISKRFVKRAPEKTALFNTLKIIGLRTACKPFDESKQSNGGLLSDHFVDGVKRLLQIIPVSLLVLPFNIVYAQMTTLYIVQGEAMKTVGIFGPSFMSNFDSISVLITGVVTGSLLYPFLDRRGIHFCLTHRFSLGCAFGALSILSALVVDNAIRNQYINNGSQISILWLIFNYAFVGIGEMFAVSTSYEAAFTIAPKEQKVRCEDLNVFILYG
jgi:dipeptide/tripeptide permease